MAVSGDACEKAATGGVAEMEISAWLELAQALQPGGDHPTSILRSILNA
jgi:hypothetical protein